MANPLFSEEEDMKIAKMYLDNMTAQQIADYFKCYKQSILCSLKRSGVDRRKYWNRASGKNNGNWKGGKKMIGKYLHILMPTHHLSRNSDGYVAEHRILAEKKLERELTALEVVNHIDGNTLNNSLENLEVYPNNGLHIKNHIGEFKRNKLGRFINKTK